LDTAPVGAGRFADVAGEGTPAVEAAARGHVDHAGLGFGQPTGFSPRLDEADNNRMLVSFTSTVVYATCRPHSWVDDQRPN
jgi:hypothetical protein